MTLAFVGLFSIVLTTWWSISLAQGFGNGFGVNGTETAGSGVIGAWQGQGRGLIDVIKSGINWILWMLSLITLVILLWWGFHMVTAAGDETKYKKWFVILKQAGIGLAFIALAWLIVSLIFFVISGATGGGGK